jgi:hypothetical protein
MKKRPTTRLTGVASDQLSCVVERYEDHILRWKLTQASHTFPRRGGVRFGSMLSKKDLCLQEQR